MSHLEVFPGERDEVDSRLKWDATIVSQGRHHERRGVYGMESAPIYVRHHPPCIQYRPPLKKQLHKNLAYLSRKMRKSGAATL